MSNSKLIRSKILSQHHSGRRTEKITKIAIHIMAGNLSAENCGRWFQNPRAYASSQYGIGTDGGIGLYVDEANRAWTTSSNWVDQRAVTIEVANDGGAPLWHVSDKAYQALLNLVEDICRRNGIKECTYTGDSSGTLIKHSWFANKSCPGPYLGGKFPEIAKEVTRRLKGATGGESKPAPKPTPQPQSAAIKVGDSISITGTKYVTGQVIPGWVKKQKHLVSKIDGTKALLGHPNGINSWVYLKDIQGTANKAFKPYTVKVEIKDLNIRTGAGTNYKSNGYIKPGVYTITEEKAGAGATKWGKLKSGAGWISLAYTKKTRY